MRSVQQEVWKLIKEIKPEMDLPDSAAPDTDLMNSLGFDSIQLIQLIVNLETTLDFEFEDQDMSMEHFLKLEDLVHLVEQRITEQTTL